MKTLYRAETVKQDFKEETKCLKQIEGVWYAIGNLVEIDIDYITITPRYGVDQLDTVHNVDVIRSLPYYYIKEDTLAIHFDWMVDSEDTKIFASLSKTNNKGGDIVCCAERIYYGDTKMDKYEIQMNYRNLEDYLGYQYYEDFVSYENQKVIGIVR